MEITARILLAYTTECNMALSIEHGKAHATTVSSFLSFTIPTNYEVFDFSFPNPTATLASAGTHQESSFCRKRARPLADIDGEYREITKKRRLRLTFVTSRLSAPFASPPRNNVDRGSSKIAIWAKQRVIPPHQFRKMAIMNRIKRETMALREAQQRQIEFARQQHLSASLSLQKTKQSLTLNSEKLMASPPRRTSKRLQSKKDSKQVTVQKKTVQENRGFQKPVREYRKIAPGI